MNEKSNNFDYCLQLLKATAGKVRAYRAAGRIVVTLRADLVVEFSPGSAKGSGSWQLRNGARAGTGVRQLVAYSNAFASAG
ncbi:hypothetical protein [Duganella vulcania]|uniref:Uncharacterized protein n=1 Tax=Duganella vulcania TaxID=2692166 RepID=A0A845GD65_9BURK|nr:hypothetical protein [Duganella vulcania]MYM92563.1 hypothetical protein [Duganella vulcania]